MKQHQTKIQLRFSDFDVLRHVNNAKYATFMENARIDFFQDVIAPHHDWKEVGILIARLEFDFKIPVHMTDELIVLSHVSAIGTKSLTFDHQFTVNGDSGILLKATGASVAVCYNYARNNSMVVPPLWRQRINAYQGTEL